MIPSVFQNPSLIRLVKTIRAESTGENRCLISRLQVTSKNSVCLPCNHIFHIDYYTNIKKKHNCPYCGKWYNVNLLEKPCTHLECSEMTTIQNGICKKHNKTTCTHVLSKGKRKGDACGANVINNSTPFCSRHCSR